MGVAMLGFKVAAPFSKDWVVALLRVHVESTRFLFLTFLVPGGGKHSIILPKISNQVISVFCWLSATLECSPISKRKPSGPLKIIIVYGIFMYRLGSSPMWLSTLMSTYSGSSTSNVSFPRTED